MKELIFNTTFIFQILVFIISSYYMFISFFGLKLKKEDEREVEPQKSFALVVAAHNEEMVIAQIVESLKNLDYPKELYDIFVIADNCTDNTAKIAKEHGAQVFERFDTTKRGKGYALEWMFNNIFNMDKKYDAIVVFDADNLASRNFLKEMNKKLVEGYKVVQGYIDSKNPDDSWITHSYSIAFWSANRLFQAARWKLGLSNQIGGTGFCVETDLLKRFGWGATCLTEDLEFTCKLVLNGYKVGWAHNAVVYDEKPLTLKQSWNQRKRWMQGFADVATRYFSRLIKKAIKDRDFVAFDCALYTIQPFIILALGMSLVLTYLQTHSERGLNIFILQYLFTPLLWKLFSVFQFMFTPVVMTLERKLSKTMLVFFGLYSLNVFLMDRVVTKGDNIVKISLLNLAYLTIVSVAILSVEGIKGFKVYVWYLLYGFYTLTWIPITVQGIIDKNKKEWSHTKHTRQISISEIEGIDGQTAA